MRRLLLFFIVPITLASCSAGKNSFSAKKKYSPAQLQKDYSIYHDLLEEHHPSLYWYNTKDSIDYYFNWGEQQLKDSLTEPEFRKVLSYVTSKINCGHTSVRSSKAWNKYSDTVRLAKMFPLSMKIWPDTMVVAANLNRRDSILKRGTVVTSINGHTLFSLMDTLFNYISSDGYNTTHKYQSLSNRGYFGSLYTSLYGLSEKYSIEYVDSVGQLKTTIIPVYNPIADTPTRRTGQRPVRTTPTPPQPSKKQIKEQQLNNTRLLKIDSVNHTAMMNLSTFAKGSGFRQFFRTSFRALKKNNIGHLIIDVRGNGGGNISNSTLITRYMIDNKFKIADSLYATHKKSEYNKYIQNHFWNKLFISLFTKKRNDGNYHFGYFERHYFKPKKENHFTGKAYIITGGNSFSATTLFAAALIKQENVIVVGEETGGGSYGNSAWLIPDVTLPVTGVRFRLPLFRLVIDKNAPKNGRGIIPEVESDPTVSAIIRNADYKLDKVMELIKKDKEEKK